MLKRWWQWILRHEGLVLLLLLVVVLRIPSLYEPYWYGDEGIYLVLGQGLKKGLVFYRDIHDNKPPLLYILAAIAGNVFYFRLLLMVWFGATVAIFYRLMQMLFPKNKWAWYLSTILMIGGTTITEGNIANAEIFMAGPVTLAVLLIYEMKVKKKKDELKRWLGAGVLLAVGFLLKVPAGADLAAVLIWLGFFERKKIWSFWQDKKLWLVIIGFLTPVLITVLYYGAVGGGERYVRSALLQNIGYLASWKTGEHSASGFSSQSGLMIRTEVLLVLTLGWYWLVRKFKLSSGAGLVVIWFLWALWGALLSERPYPHYLIQPMVPAAILVSFFVFGKRKLLKMVILGVGLVTALSYYQIRFWHYSTRAYYKNFVTYALKNKSREEYFNFFDKRVNQNYKVAEYIKKRTTPEERIFVWGDEPSIYALSERLPIGRYTTAYHVSDFNGYRETIEAWDKYRPSLVVVMEYENREFPNMETILSTDYVLVETIEQAKIFVRVDGVNKV